MMSLGAGTRRLQSSRSDLSVSVRYANAPVQLSPAGSPGLRWKAGSRATAPVAPAGWCCAASSPGADYSGMGTARGYDNDGRFVGAKLAFTF